MSQTGIQLSSSTLAGLGLVAKGKRSIGNGARYNQYFDLNGLEKTDPIIVNNGSNFDTLREMEKIAKAHTSQISAIANHLKSSTTTATLRNLFNFLYNNVQYKPDSEKFEQLRTPLRTWNDRASGVDCDCFSIFISAVLHYLKINHAFRMAAYSGDYQHVYVVVPLDGKESSLAVRTKYIVVDPVVDSFNYEVPFTKKYDRFMSLKAGLGATSELTAPTVCGKNRRNTGDDLIRVARLKEDGFTITEEYLVKNGISYSAQRLGDNSIRLNVTTPAGEALSLRPIMGATDLQSFIAKMTAPIPPVKDPVNQSKKTHGFWYALAGAAAATVIYAIGKSGNKKSSGLSGAPVSAKRTPKVVHI